jgi:hypothetical protein
MTTISASPEHLTDVPPRPGRRRWGPARYFAVVGLLAIVWQGWTWVAWLASGPTSAISQGRHGASYYVAVVYQAIALLMAATVITIVVRQCVRARRLTFDARFCIAGLLTWWMDPLCNWIQPLFLFNSSWVNVHDWSGHVPFILNPDAGRGIELPLFTLPMYACGFLVNTAILSAVWRALLRRWPWLSPANLVIIGFFGGALIEVIMEFPVILTRTWTFAGAPQWGSIPIGSTRMPLIEWATGGVAFTTLTAIRFFRDDEGFTVAERRTGRAGSRRQIAMSTLALVGLLNTLWFGLNVSYAVVGLYSAPYSRMPANLVNGACTAPGLPATRYGPCPGASGYRLPIRGSLPGPKP